MEHIEYLLPWSASGTERKLSLFRFWQRIAQGLHSGVPARRRVAGDARGG